MGLPNAINTLLTYFQGEHGFSLTACFPVQGQIKDSAIIGEHAGQGKPIFWNILGRAEILAIYIAWSTKAKSKKQKQ